MMEQARGSLHFTVASQHQLTAKLARRDVNLLHIHADFSVVAILPGGGGSEDAMTEYRVYLVDRDGHFFDVVALNCANDTEATDNALRLAVGHGVELWQLDRKVAVFPDQNITGG